MIHWVQHILNICLAELSRLASEHDVPVTDDVLFEESRRLVIAQMQNVVYAEYLPEILGKRRAISQKLSLGPKRTTYMFNVSIFPFLFEKENHKCLMYSILGCFKV